MIQKAKKLLKENKYTFVAISADEIYTSQKRGVAPILDKIDENPDFFKGAVIADKVIGKAAAMLLVRYGVSEIFAVLTSEKAIEYIKNKPVKLTYDNKTGYIINRDKTDMCPMEKAVFDTDDEALGEKLIKEKRNQLMKG